MPMTVCFDPVNMMGTIGIDHFRGLEINREIRSLFRADRAPVVGGNSNPNKKRRENQDAEPFFTQKKFDYFL